MGRVEEQTVVAKGQGVVCEFIRPMVVTFRQRWVHYRKSESCESDA